MKEISIIGATSALESVQKEIIWNVATGKGNAAAEILDLILKSSGFEKPEINHVENYASDVSLEDGISKVLENWRRTEKSVPFA